ncbi:phosphodiester glycosidase family protein [Amycolatopsis circi]|uniref:phosphodiester glycosidase family protein n=1 Tax=Amycolatopsis circi TaxID=871959 RepID=UPI000E22224D|nr:phosphodiester glycosidase family protein [Amycolatopsis circi]
MAAAPILTTPAPRRRRHRGRIALVLLAVVLAYPAGSYVRALAYPGNASFAVRTVDWLRDIGLGGVVNAAENWWYTRHPPANAAPAPSDLPAPAASRTPAAGPRPAPIRHRFGAPAGEGVWVAGARSGDRTAEYTTFLQPDPRHASVVAGVAWLDQGLVRTRLFAGTKDFRGPGPNVVPATLRSSLVAVFNSGFKLKDSNGGVYLDGTTVAPLRPGRASAVVDDTGRVSIAQWGRDASLTDHVVAVRQNLDLVVDHGSTVPDLGRNPAGAWGSASNQYQYTWRSGLGTDRAGDLIYVAGNGLTLDTLAAAMAQAGIQQGMELDIHSPMVTFDSYRPDLPGRGPTKLLPGIPGAADRYLQPDQRDFFATALRSFGSLPVGAPRGVAGT